MTSPPSSGTPTACWGSRAQQTLDYLQNLYEKKLCTYPRTDSRYLTSDMAEGLPVLVNLVANAMPFRKGIAISCDAAAVINDKKVTDHHAVIPTRNIREEDLTALPVGERAILELVALRLLCAVASPIPLRKLPLLWSAPVRSLPPRANTRSSVLAGAGCRLPGQHEKCAGSGRQFRR